MISKQEGSSNKTKLTWNNLNYDKSGRNLLLPLHLCIGTCGLCILHASLVPPARSQSHHLAPLMQLDLDYESHKISRGSFTLTYHLFGKPLRRIYD